MLIEDPCTLTCRFCINKIIVVPKICENTGALLILIDRAADEQLSFNAEIALSFEHCRVADPDQFFLIDYASIQLKKAYQSVAFFLTPFVFDVVRSSRRHCRLRFAASASSEILQIPC